MASVTLEQSAKLAQDDLVAGVIEQVITVNQMFQVLPFDAIDGNALKYNRELNIDNLSAAAGVGTNLSSGNANYKRAAEFTSVFSSLTKIIGDAEVDNLIQATRSGDGNDQEAIQVASKAKSIGRKYQNQLINGTGSNDEFEGLKSLVASSQKVDTGDAVGSVLTFEIMDELIDLVIDKDGEVDYFAMNARTRRQYRALLRALGGAAITEVVQLPSGDEVMAYSGVPVFKNDYIPMDEDVPGGDGSVTNATTVYAGTLDDGSRSHGIAGLTAANAAGIQVVPIGESETKDETITRVRWYCGLANFSEKGLASAEGILPTA